jgi:type I restriction enzyme M protein
LVNEPVQDVTVYDPSAGSGTLLMNIAHAIGEDKCTIYSQDISQKSSSLLRLNLILNNLVHSISNIIQGNTIHHPYHKADDGELEKFDYIVSNPPFKLDFSDFRDDLDSKENHERFFAGIPNVPKKDKEGMKIYTLFLQHIVHSLSKVGKAAIVVPTGFITHKSGIEKKIREFMVEQKMFSGAITMPSNIFATTNTNVTILFLEKNNSKDIVLIDASKIGEVVKEGKNQKTVLTDIEENCIIDSFNQRKNIKDFSVIVNKEDLKARNYSFSAGQYFEVDLEHIDISLEEFKQSISNTEISLSDLFLSSKQIEEDITNNLKTLNYE